MSDSKDTNTDSDESVVFVGVSKNIQVKADIHQHMENVNANPKKTKRRRILPDERDPTFIPDTEGNYTFKAYKTSYKVFLIQLE